MTKDDEGGAKTPTEKFLGKAGSFLSKSYDKSELALKHAVGLGQSEDVVPDSEPFINGPVRPVEVGWHPVGGLAGKWFAESTGLGKMITERINEYPDPTQHWAVLVGDFAHQLWMDENFDVIYINARVDPKEWKTFQVGQTTYNDQAIKQAGQAVIQKIRETRPGYNLIQNNCQTYVLQLLNAIQVNPNQDIGTTQAIYQRLLGPGKIADFFVDSDGNLQVNEQQPAAALPVAPIVPTGPQEFGVIGAANTNANGQDWVPQKVDMVPEHGNDMSSHGNNVMFAQKIMRQNTVFLNPEVEAQKGPQEFSRGMEPEDEKKKKKSNSMLKKFKKMF